MSAITPNREQFARLTAATDEGPVVMLNLLKYKERADSGDGSGEESYARYGRDARRMVEERGGKILWYGRAEQVLIGDESQDWDAVALVEYPSRKAFVEMAMSEEMNRAHGNREGGLERTVLIACRETGRALG